MDAGISKGTGTPVPNGITEKEAGNLVARLMESPKVCCFEIVEINPTLDKENLMAENAFEILQKATTLSNPVVYGEDLCSEFENYFSSFFFSTISLCASARDLFKSLSSSSNNSFVMICASTSIFWIFTCSSLFST